MPLDLSDAAVQVDRMATDLKGRQADLRLRLRNALTALRAFDVAAFDVRRQEASGSWFLPRIDDAPDARYPSPPPLQDFTVAGVDGSHIDMGRHLAARCFLINVGVATLTYGSGSNADLFSRPRLYATDDDLALRDETSGDRQSVEGAVLGAKRAVDEIRALVEVIRNLPGDVPILGLLDGSLATIGLVGRLFPEFVQRELLSRGFAAALEELGGIAQTRRLAVASYVSLPRSSEVANALKLVSCEYGAEDAARRCGPPGSGPEQCSVCVAGPLDRDLFAEVLRPGERSALFESTSATVEKYYEGLGVHFFYLHAGEEIGRVEVPSWVAEGEDLLGFTHALIVDQCVKGQGYPVALMESHEQAVLTVGDRRSFTTLVERALEDRLLPAFTSEKSMSKSIRWL